MDQQEVVRILLRERTRLTAYVWSILRDGHEADDLFQDLCLRAMGEAGTFNDETHLLKWTTLAARSRAIDALRAARRQVRTLDASVLATLEAGWLDADLPSGDLSEALEHCVGALPEHSRRLLHLRYREAQDGAAIARATGRNRDAIYKALTRIHQALHDCITRRVGGVGAVAGGTRDA